MDWNYYLKSVYNTYANVQVMLTRTFSLIFPLVPESELFFCPVIDPILYFDTAFSVVYIRYATVLIGRDYGEKYCTMNG